MGRLENFKKMFNCLKKGNIKEYNTYKRMVSICEKDISRYEKYIENSKEKLNEWKKQNYSDTSQKAYEYRQDIKKWQYNLDETELKKDFLRPNFQKDVEYRDNHHNTEDFVEKLKKFKSKKLNLVFYATPIYFAKKIIETGEITCLPDRNKGYATDNYSSGKISVADIDSLKETLDLFAGLTSYKDCLPAGCIFAIYPKSDKDFDKNSGKIHSLNFKISPEQLYGIFTTPENLNNVKLWLNEAGLNPELTYDYEGFLQAVNKTSKELDKNSELEICEEVSPEIVNEIKKVKKPKQLIVEVEGEEIQK